MRPEELEYPQKTMYQFAWDNNKDYLQGIAFQYFDKQISYKVFFDNVESAAKSLVSRGVRARDIVTVMSMHTPETVYVIYALNYIGATANLVYMTLSEKELIDTVKNTGSKLLFVLDVATPKAECVKDKLGVSTVLLPVDRSMPSLIRWIYHIKERKTKKSYVTGIMSFDDFLRQGRVVAEIDVANDPSALAVIVYTSGTTGVPKGVCLSNNNLNYLATQDYCGLLDFQRGKDSLLILPPFIGFGVSMLHVQISSGIKSILQIVLEPRAICKNLFKYKPYCYMTGPALIEFFLAQKPRNLRSLRYFISGGGSVTEEQQRRCDSFLAECGTKAKFSNGYGMTEACAVLCLCVNDVNKVGSVGIPFIDTNVRVNDVDTGEELSYRVFIYCQHLTRFTLTMCNQLWILLIALKNVPL